VDSNILDNLLETAEILSDPEMMRQINESQEDVEKGRVYCYDSIEELIASLKN
jgi:hypothetical protein